MIADAMKNKIHYLVFFVLSIMGCEKINDSYPNENQLVLFQVEYINYAWGYSHHEILIDSSGNVRYFKYPNSWHQPDTAGYITESDMNENIQQLDSVSLTIENDILFKYFSILKGASEGHLSHLVNRMFDAGTTIYSGYLFDSIMKEYKHVLIKQWGDWSIENNSPEAEKIYRWLESTFHYVLENLRSNN
jgi:hypothetical protein